MRHGKFFTPINRALAAGPMHVRAIADTIGTTLNYTAPTLSAMSKMKLVARCGGGIYRLPLAGEEPEAILRNYTWAQLRAVLVDMAAGAPPSEAAKKHGVSYGWASDIAYKPHTAIPHGEREWFLAQIATIRALKAERARDRKALAAARREAATKARVAPPVYRRVKRSDAEWLGLARAQADRFHSKVNRTDRCWVWTAGTSKFGYGKFAITAPRHELPKQKHVPAHRLAWELEHGVIPGGLFVLHECDNPPCVRPDHLRLGTQGDNVRDCAAKGRIARGERGGAHVHPERVVCGESHHKARMTLEKAIEIRRLRSGGARTCDITRALGITYGQASSVIYGKSWARALQRHAGSVSP